MLRIRAAAFFAALLTLAAGAAADALKAGDHCYKDGASITIRGMAVAEQLSLADGGTKEVWLLMLDSPMCVLGADDADRMQASSVGRVQIVGRPPPTNTKIELTGRLSTLNITQWYAVPTAIIVASGRKVDAESQTPARRFDGSKVAELMNQRKDQPAPKPNDFTAGIGTTILWIIIALYFLPAIVASLRRHHNANAIFLLNLFLGWTFLGWVVALVWAATATQRPAPG